MSEALVKSVQGKQGWVNLTTEDIPVGGDSQYMTTDDKLTLGKLEAQTRDLRTHTFDKNIHVDKNILTQVKTSTTHQLNEVSHLSRGMKKKLKDHLDKPHDGRRGLRGHKGDPGLPGPVSSDGGGSVRTGTVTGQMLYWDNTVQVWEPSVVTDLGWDNTEKLLIVGSTDPSIKNPGISFRTTRGTVNRVDLIMDESSSHDKVSFVGKTLLKNLFVQIMALDGEDANLLLFSGGAYSLISHDANDDFIFMATAEDKDMIFSINRGSVITEVLCFEGLTSIARFPAGHVHIDHVAIINGDHLLHIDCDPNTYDNVSAIEVNYSLTDFDHPDAIGNVLDVILDNMGASAGDFHVIDVALSDPANQTVEVEALATHEGVAPIAQYLGDPADLDSAWSNDSGVFTDRQAVFDDAGTNVQIFTAYNDYILVACTSKFDEINILLSIAASHTIIPVFEYSVDDGTWVPFMVADDTDGFSNNGTVRFESDSLTTWGQRTINEITGEVGVVDFYWVRITRTRGILPTPPTESTIHLTVLGFKYHWSSHGNVNIKSLAVDDGIAVPDAIAGQAIIYVDIADGDLKVRFSNGFIATIAADS